MQGSLFTLNSGWSLQTSSKWAQTLWALPLSFHGRGESALQNLEWDHRSCNRHLSLPKILPLYLPLWPCLVLALAPLSSWYCSLHHLNPYSCLCHVVASLPVSLRSDHPQCCACPAQGWLLGFPLSVPTSLPVLRLQ